MRFVGVLASSAILLATTTAAGKSAEVEATGMAAIEKSDEPTARQKAINNALTQAIAQVAGQWVQSRFEATQQEHTRDQETAFVSRVEDSVRTDVQGFVETYKVLREERAGPNYRVTVSAVVNTRKLNDLFGALQELLEKKKWKALVITREVDATKNAPVSGQAGAFVENELTKVGLELVSHGSPSASADLMTLADHEGRQSGADVVLLVEAKYKNLGVIGPGAEFEALVGQTRIELELTLRSALVEQRRIMSSKPVTMTSIGTSYERALARVLGGKGQNAVRQATEDFFQELLKELQKPAKTAPPAPAVQVSAQVAVPAPTSLRLVIERVKSFKKLGRPLIDLIGKANGVKGVAQTAFAGDKLELSVDFSGDQSALEKFIFDECEKQRFCKTIDRKSSAPNELVLRL
ncbi:MAG: flagellar assembly protein T N-terminal domain-containing protein [Deltaproteobacteria bacterium]|nr:flagellar assembly protein T N-terminal domain-containing protein [Deltaproteobacteria bacterium]